MKKLSIERLFLVDFYNEKHMEMLNLFEKSQGMETKTSEYLRSLCASIPKEKYIENKKKRNDIEEYLFIEKEGKIIDICTIQGEKDIKIGKINIPNLKEPLPKRKLINLATDYAIEILGMEEVFISIEKEDKNTKSYLLRQDFENLGEENGKNLFLKEREDNKTMKRTKE